MHLPFRTFSPALPPTCRYQPLAQCLCVRIPLYLRAPSARLYFIPPRFRSATPNNALFSLLRQTSRPGIYSAILYHGSFILSNLFESGRAKMWADNEQDPRPQDRRGRKLVTVQRCDFEFFFQMVDLQASSFLVCGRDLRLSGMLRPRSAKRL